MGLRSGRKRPKPLHVSTGAAALPAFRRPSGFVQDLDAANPHSIPSSRWIFYRLRGVPLAVGEGRDVAQAKQALVRRNQGQSQDFGGGGKEAIRGITMQRA